MVSPVTQRAVVDNLDLEQPPGWDMGSGLAISILRLQLSRRLISFNRKEFFARISSFQRYNLKGGQKKGP